MARQAIGFSGCPLGSGTNGASRPLSRWGISWTYVGSQKFCELVRAASRVRPGIVPLGGPLRACQGDWFLAGGVLVAHRARKRVLPPQKSWSTRRQSKKWSDGRLGLSVPRLDLNRHGAERAYTHVDSGTFFCHGRQVFSRNAARHTRFSNVLSDCAAKILRRRWSVGLTGVTSTFRPARDAV